MLELMQIVSQPVRSLTNVRDDRNMLEMTVKIVSVQVRHCLIPSRLRRKFEITQHAYGLCRGRTEAGDDYVQIKTRHLMR